MGNFNALRVHDENGVEARLERIDLDQLNPGEVVIRAAYSSLNYKDALAVTGRGKIVRRYPMVAGIDVAGTVESSEDPNFSKGDEVLVTGYGLSEQHDGGYSERVRVRSEFVIPLPDGLSLRESMAIGTAGFTAGLALEKLERNGTHPAVGPVLVTGATGGVGSVAIDILNKSGYQVTALTGKRDQAGYLETLGADTVMFADEIESSKRPLEKTLWGAAIDSVGGDLLAWVAKTTKSECNVASIGLAGGHELHTTVMPFILRGVSLIGIDSVYCPRDLRERVWQRLANELKPRHLDRIVRDEIGLADVQRTAEALMNRQVAGRFLVKIS